MPRITVGVPVYKGADLLPKALECLQGQTFRDFEAIISVDGNDSETAAVCRPFLADSRFRMVVHSDRLDWVGNFNWLLQQDLQEFFCYRQHDDTTAPEFFEALIRVADKEPGAAAIYCDCKYSGGRSDVEAALSIKGDSPLDRMFQYVARLPNLMPTPVRGLIRSAAIRQAGLVRADEFRAALQLLGWLANVLRWGDFTRVPQPLYYRLDHARSYTREFWTGAYKNAWTTIFTGLLDAAMRVCRTPAERQFFQQLVLDRVVAYPGFQRNDDAHFAHELGKACLMRLEQEGRPDLLDGMPAALDQLQERVAVLRSIERTRVGRAVSQARQNYRFARVAYVGSPGRRINYQIRHLAELAGKAARLLGNS